MVVRPRFYGHIRIPVMLMFETMPRPGGTADKFRILREVLCICTKNSALYQELQPVVPYVKVKKPTQMPMEVVRSDNKPDLK